MLDRAERPAPAPVLAGQGHGPGLREAVGPHPQLHGDGGGAAGRPPGHHPGRRGRPRRPRERRGRHPHAGLLPRRHRGPGLRARQGRAHGRGRRRCRSSTCSPTPATRCRPWPTCSPSARSSAPSTVAAVTYVGDGNNVCRSLALAAGAGRHAGPDRHARRATSCRPTDLDRLAPGRASSPSCSTGPREAVAGADVVYTDVWTSMGQEAEAEAPAPGLRGLHRRRPPAGRGRARRPSSCTACPPTAARR